MRHRLASWRPPRLQSQPPLHPSPGFHRTLTAEARQHRPRTTWRRNETEDGDVYYTILPRSERKHQPRPLEPHELFQMPDVVLDLDAQPASLVREFDASDEEGAGAEIEFDAVRRRRRARDAVGEILTMVGERRRTTPAMMTSLVNPWRVTDHDVLSVALRGVLDGSIPQTGTVQPSEDGSEPRIVRLTQHHKDMYAAKSEQTIHPDALRDPHEPYKATLTATENLVVGGDPRRSPDIIKEVRLRSGIPPHVARDEKNLIRWMLVHREASLHTQNRDVRRSKHQPVDPNELAQALEAQESAASLRRLVFLSLASVKDKTFIGEWATVPTAIGDACIRILRQSKPDTRHQEILAFVNSLEQNLHEDASSGHWAWISAVRLRCLAELRMLDFTEQALRASASSLSKLSSTRGFDIVEDIEATLHSWLSALNDSVGNLSAGNTQRRQQLFRIMTGSGDRVASLRSMLSEAALPDKDSRWRAWKPYLTLLGRLGATRTLCKEWEGLARDFGQHDQLATHFLGALSTAAATMDSKNLAPIANMDLAQCAAQDEKTIGSREERSKDEEVPKDETPPEAISFQAMDDLMGLPFDKCIATVQERSHRR